MFKRFLHSSSSPLSQKKQPTRVLSPLLILPTLSNKTNLAVAFSPYSIALILLLSYMTRYSTSSSSYSYSSSCIQTRVSCCRSSPDSPFRSYPNLLFSFIFMWLMCKKWQRGSYLGLFKILSLRKGICCVQIHLRLHTSRFACICLRIFHL